MLGYKQRPVVSTSPVDGVMKLQAELFGGSYQGGVLVTRTKGRKKFTYSPIGGDLRKPEIEDAVRKALNQRRS